MNKNELLQGLHQENRQWEALLAQIGPARMDTPGAEGHWSIKDIVAHLAGWRRRTVARFQSVQRDDAVPANPWPSHLETDDEINAWIYESNRTRSVADVLADSSQVFAQLVAAIEALPEETLSDTRRFPWMEGEPLSAAAFFAHFHEEHEPDMRAWLAKMEQA